MPDQEYDLFLSHASEDKDWRVKIADNHYTAESLAKEFYSPEAVREVLEKYTK